MSVLSSPDEFLGRAGRGEIALAGGAAAIAWPCADCSAEAAAVPRLPLVDRAARAMVLRRLAKIERGSLLVLDGNEALALGEETNEAPALITVCNPRVWRRLATGGSLAAAESYLQGDWECDDLTAALRVFARNAATLRSIERGLPRLVAPWRRAWHWLRRNSRAGSRRNIAAHYDLSNDFFALMLDETMAYSANIFATRETSLHEASLAKLERVCRKLELSPRDHLLEIGCGWGGLAIYAAQNFGCRVTATTISPAQFDFAQQKVRQAGVEGRVTLVLQDYRDLDGQFDKLVSIEMIEAVGEQFLDGYFRQCSHLLKPQGMMLLQAITMPHERYARYRRSVDFIQHYIFPGGFLPSVSAIAASLGRATDLRMFHFEDLAPHYALTLARWRENFWRNIDAVRGLGFDERFIRMWHYYLCFCEAGFHERATGVAQLVLTKPDCRSGGF